MEEIEKQKKNEEKIQGGEKINAREFLKDIEKIREELLKNDPKRFENDESNRS